MGGIQKTPDEEIERVVRTAIERGVNFFDLCAGGKNVYAPFGRAIAGQRDRVYFQPHFGAVYKENGDYAWSRDLDEIKRTLSTPRTITSATTTWGSARCPRARSSFAGARRKG